MFIETKVEGITVSHIDEKSVLAAYQKNVLDKARETINGWRGRFFAIPQRAYDKRRQKKDKPFIFSEYEGLFSFIMSWSKAKKKTKNDKASNLNCTPFPKKRKGVQ